MGVVQMWGRGGQEGSRKEGAELFINDLSSSGGGGLWMAGLGVGAACASHCSCARPPRPLIGSPCADLEGRAKSLLAEYKQDPARLQAMAQRMQVSRSPCGLVRLGALSDLFPPLPLFQAPP